MRSSADNARPARCFALVVALAGCGADDERGETGLSSGSDGAVSTTTGDVETDSDGVDTTAGDAQTSDASATTGDATGDALDTSTGEPLDCGALTPCGVQCVDVASDPENCGQCGVSCVIPNAEAACVAGECAIGECLSGQADCDGDLFNGCEALMGGGEACPLVCAPGTPEACNLFDDDCDGGCDLGAPGCRQGVHRAYSPTLGHLYTLDQAEASSGDFHLESANFFFLYAAAQPGLAPLYRCLLGNGKRFYTSSESCEGAGQNEGPLGYLAGDPLCGGTPLYRLYKSGAGHFYTISAGERDNAVNNLGYLFEATVGHVWTGG
ncbi:MAG: hypothetical protein H6713_38640 [Myxococcales bacterium]|nr:hypothetical protein [Myxococcales bacterium]